MSQERGDEGVDHRMSDLAALKQAAAEKAVQYVRGGMVVGLGTGSTAKLMILALGERVRAGLSIRGVPTSLETAKLARNNGIPLLETEDAWTIDLAIDGADQVDAQLNLIKGGGGALLEKRSWRSRLGSSSSSSITRSGLRSWVIRCRCLSR